MLVECKKLHYVLLILKQVTSNSHFQGDYSSVGVIEMGFIQLKIAVLAKNYVIFFAKISYKTK